MHTNASTAPITSTASLRAFSQSLPGRITLGIAATLVVAFAAHVSVPLPFTPVPLIMTPLAVLGVGLALGPVAGFAAMVAYLLEGAAGLPVFSPTGPGGLLQLLGPTGGYLLSYPLVAAIAGGAAKALSTRLPRFAAAAIACTVAIAVLFTAGAFWFAHLVPSISAHAVWIGSIAPFLPGEVVKVLAAAGIYSTLTNRASRA
ncbi:MAG: biotin transporter BioY [Acidobacteriaceae bacterium]|nr:biotin transporter BioY [Acidobacteriaceae bacterium]